MGKEMEPNTEDVTAERIVFNEKKQAGNKIRASREVKKQLKGF